MCAIIIPYRFGNINFETIFCNFTKKETFRVKKVSLFYLKHSKKGFRFWVVNRLYGRSPMPPSSVMVSPLINLKSGEDSCTQARPISVSTLP